MKMIPVRQAQTKWMNALKKNPFIPITLYTFKKDRYVSLQKTENQYYLIESGYIHEKTALEPDKARKLLKSAFDREFPRSSRLYIEEKRISE